jgi:hypothetical protein
MKAKELIEILAEDPEREVYIALASIRVDTIKGVFATMVADGSLTNMVPSFKIVPSSYKAVETKGVDY